MAINLFTKYGSRANPPSIDYPEGSIKNRSAPDAKDGTPLDADWANDHQGFFQSLLSEAGMAANGTPDKVGESQYFDALKSVTQFQESGMVVFNTTGVHTWLVPEVLRSGKKTARVRGCGGGGSGAWANNAYASGGGGGGYFEISALSLEGVESVTVTVGAGGAAVASIGSSGVPGNSTSFGIYASAGGGGGGSLLIDTNPTGGVAVSGEPSAFLVEGGRGGGGVMSADGTSRLGGSGGGCILGNPGVSLKANSYSLGYGAGSGGRANAVVAGSNSAKGGDGVVIIEY